MTAKQNDLSGGAHGTAVTLANSAGGGDAFDDKSTTGTITYDTSLGPAVKLVSTSSASTYLQWSAVGGNRIAGRVELYLPAYADPDIQIMVFFEIYMSGSNHLLVYTDHQGKLTLFEASVGNIALSSVGALPLNTWFRIEFDFLTVNPGTYDLRIYPDTTSTTATTTLSGSRTWRTPSDAASFIRLGPSEAFEVKTYYIGHPQINNVGLPGPYVPITIRDIEPSTMEMYSDASVPTVRLLTPIDIIPPTMEMYAEIGAPDVVLTPMHTVVAPTLSTYSELRVPTVTLTAPPGPQDPDGVGGDNFVDAWPITVTQEGNTYKSLIFSNAGYTDEVGEPFTERPLSAWWSYTPRQDGTIYLDNGRGSGDRLLYVFESSGPPHTFDNLSFVGVDDDSFGGGGSLISNLGVTAGKTYFIKVASFDGAVMNYALDLTGPATVPQVPPRIIDIPALGDIVNDSSSPTVEMVSIQIRPIPAFVDVVMEMFVPQLVFPGTHRISVPRFTDIEHELMAADVRGYAVIAAYPDDAVTVPVVSDMSFGFVITSDDPDTQIEVQMDDNDLFDTPTSTTVAAENLDGTDTNYVIVSGPFLEIPYYWRYRLIVGGVAAPWSATRVFTVDIEAAATEYTGSWVVTTGTAAPVIWFVFPAGGQTGDEVTLFGQGLNRTTATVLVGTVTAAIDTKETIDADTTLPPIIDETSGMVTIAHDEVSFFIPDVPAPGAEVTVSV